MLIKHVLLSSQEIFDKITNFNYQKLTKDEIKDFFKLLELYAKYDDDLAMNNLGFLYNNIYKDCKKTEEWYLKSANIGNSIAMYNLGFFYENYKDYKKAEEWYLKSANLGNIRAMNNLGFFYENIYKDSKKAEEWYLKGASLGDSSAIYNLLYNNFIDNIDENIITYMSKEQLQKYDKLIEKNIPLEKIYGSLEDNCNICYEKLIGAKSGIYILQCGHIYHTNCVKSCYCCPYCKRGL